jgi:FKBP-type peptidyl-prolyl cis-trans isomerase
MIRNKIQTIALLATAVIMITVSSCDPDKKMQKEEASLIQNYLAKNNNLNFVLKPSGLYYMQVVPGTGRTPVLHDTAFIKYTGKLLDGTVFDSNVGTSKTLISIVGEGYLISGFDEGITYMAEGGKSTLLIPSQLGYGTYGSYPISGYSPLLFDVELIQVKPGPGR